MVTCNSHDRYDHPPVSHTEAVIFISCRENIADSVSRMISSIIFSLCYMWCKRIQQGFHSPGFHPPRFSLTTVSFHSVSFHTTSLHTVSVQTVSVHKIPDHTTPAHRISIHRVLSARLQTRALVPAIAASGTPLAVRFPGDGARKSRTYGAGDSSHWRIRGLCWA